MRPLQPQYCLHMGPKKEALGAREEKPDFSRLIDTAHVNPVAIEKHERPVVMVLPVEEYERQKACEESAPPPTNNSKGKV